MYKTFIDTIIFILLIGMAFSPAFVFRLIDVYFLREQVRVFDRDIFSEPVDIKHNMNNTFHQPMNVERDEVIHNNLRRMVLNSEGKPSNQMWKIKLWEFERRLQWENIMDKSHGYEYATKVTS
jgi:hypothetical protein